MTFRSAASPAFAAALLLTPGLAQAQSPSVLQYTAKSTVVGATNINDSRYSTPVSPAYNGVGSIRVTTAYDSAGFAKSRQYICTGSLLADGKTVLTAGHCLTPTSLGPNESNEVTTAISVNFYPTGATAVTLNAASWNANPLYSGAVIDENDIAVLHLAAEAPSNISRYDLYTGNAENDPFNFVGFGQKGSNGAGVSIGAGFSLANRRHGANVFDIRLGDARWEGFWDDPNAFTDNVLFADFDNGTTGYRSNDGMCWIGEFFSLMGQSECSAGLGLYEAITGGGDSGGPGFVDGKIASVTSFGLTFGNGFYQLCDDLSNPACVKRGPDINNSLNSSFGEYAGFTDVAYQSAWITTQMDLTSLDATVVGPYATPEPASMVLLGTGLLLVGGVVRRRNRKLDA